MTDKELEKALNRCFQRTPNRVKKQQSGYNKAARKYYKASDRGVLTRKEVNILASGYTTI